MIEDSGNPVLPVQEKKERQRREAAEAEAKAAAEAAPDQVVASSTSAPDATAASAPDAAAANNQVRGWDSCATSSWSTSCTVIVWACQ